jgi:hypothetical protein
MSNINLKEPTPLQVVYNSAIMGIFRMATK